MDMPAVDHLMQTVRKLSEIGQRARSGDPSIDDYLELIKADPTTDWFTDLLRENRAELEKEKLRADQLAATMRAWYRAKQVSSGDADAQFIHALRAMGVIAQ